MAALIFRTQGIGRFGLATVLIGAMASWGLNMSAVKALSSALSPLSLAASRMVLAALALAACSACMRERWPPMTRSLWLRCGIAAATMVYGYQVGLVEGLRTSSASNASLIVSLIPLISFILVAGYQRALPHASVWLGLMLALVGVVLVVLLRPGVGWRGLVVGDAWLLAAAVLFAFGGVCVQSITGQLGPLRVAVLTHLLGAIGLVVHAIALDQFSAKELEGLDCEHLWILLFSGVGAAALGNLVWYRSIATFGAARTSPALYLVPMFGLIFACVLLGEAFSVWQMVALVAILIGCDLANASGSLIRSWGRPKRRRAL